MNLPGLLIEYLISGSLSLIWIICLVDLSTLPILMDNQALLLVPLIYVLGMFIDYIAWFVTRPVKNWIRGRALDDVAAHMIKEKKAFHKDEFQLFWDEKLVIEKNYPDLNKDLTSRSSRDRIARGVMINLIPITIFYWDNLHYVGIGLIILSAFMWEKFERYNRCYELRAAHSVRSLPQEKVKSKE